MLKIYWGFDGLYSIVFVRDVLWGSGYLIHNHKGDKEKMILINKQELVDDLLIIAMERNTLTIKEVYELIRKQQNIIIIK